MENTLLVALSRQVALRRELDVVANNMANMNTNGFRRDVMRFEEFLMPEGRQDAFPVRGDRRLSFVNDVATAKDFSSGAMQRTDNPLDVAIDGDGFFVVETPDGERYTRNGAFKIDNTGTLVTNTGMPVLTEQGRIAITAADGAVTIARDGSISTDQGPRGRLRLASFAEPQRLQKVGDTMFRAGDGQQAEAPAPGANSFAQGMLEESNVKPILEISRLIELNRSYSSISSLIQRGDDLRRTSIERLGEIPS